MAVRCSATEIADFVLLWGMSGTFPQYCLYAEDARNLKSIDLIISTTGVFVEAFWLRFEGIYRKLKMDSPLSEEKFIEFLKPRCLLLTKDDKCFNFMLVCTFVSEIIHLFFKYNKCFHLAKVATKCLAAILNGRFKRVFETDSGWDELMSFCIKIHGLIYPSVKKCKSDQLVGEVDESAEREDRGKISSCTFPATVTADAFFPNTSQKLTELSVEKYASDDNDDFQEKVVGKNSSTPLKKDFTIEKKGEKSKGLCKLEFSILTDKPQTFQIKDEISSSIEDSEDKEKPYEKNSREDNEKVRTTDMSNSSLSNLSQETITIAINKNDEDTDKLSQMIVSKNNVTLSFGKGFTLKTVPEKLDLCNLEPISSCSSVALQSKGEVASLNEKLKDTEKVVDEGSAMDSLLSDLKHKLNMSIEKEAFNKNAVFEKPGQLIDFGKKLTPSENDTREEYTTKKLEDLCKLEPVSSGNAPHTHVLKDENASLNDDSEGSEEPFSILCLTADQICSRITDNTQHLSEIMNLIKICEEDIEPNFFPPDEFDLLMSDNNDEDLKASHNTCECPRDSDLTIFELGIKTVVFATDFQKKNMDRSVKRIFRQVNQSDEESISNTSGDESSDETINGGESESDDDMLNFEEIRCPFCAGCMNKFFDACVNHFGTHWYFTHYLVTDLFSFKLQENSE